MTNDESLSGRVALVTGANTGIGLVTARELVRRGADVTIACRSEAKAKDAVAEIRRATGRDVSVLPMDLADIGSVRAAAARFLEKGTPLHLLVNNAGVAGARGFTKSGFELAFGVNHIGHFVLTVELLERIKASAPARIVTVSSHSHYRRKGIDFDAVRRPTRSLTGLPEYGVSKLANVLFSAELARRLKDAGVNTYSLHPGVVASDIWRKIPGIVRPAVKLFMIDTEEGAQTSLYCATSPDCAKETGLYYDKSRPRAPSAVSQRTDLAAELWRRSEEWVH